MRTIFALALVAGMSVSANGQVARGGHIPCVTASTQCTEWIPLGSEHARAMIYRSYPLATKDTAIRRALIMVHGTGRNADHYFNTATASAFLAHALDDTVVIAPHFSSSDKGCDDKLAEGEISWSCRGDSWRSGGSSTSDPSLTSFDFVDELVRKLADKTVFPNLKEVVIAGHSAGGQYVARYQMANRLDGTVAVTMSYVIANPSSYAWPDATRPLPEGDGTPDAAVSGWKEEKKPHTEFTFGPFDATKAPDYNKWPYGLEHRDSGYTKGVSDAQLLKQLSARPATYLLGQVDTLPLGGFDGSPSAMAQGSTRRARGEAYVKYVASKLGASANAVIVPECGHNDRCIYTTDAVLPYVFPRQ